MLKFIIYIMLIILLTLTVSGYVKQDYYNYTVDDKEHRLRLRFFDNSANKTLCYQQLDAIPPQHLRGLVAITIFPEHHSNYHYAYYHYFTKHIEMYTGDCNLWVMKHELCHHKQRMDHTPVREVTYHYPSFNQCMRERADYE